MSTIKDRIKEFLDISNLTQSEFAKKLQIQKSGLTHIFSGRNKPSIDFFVKFKSEFPDVDLNYLITGKKVYDTKENQENISQVNEPSFSSFWEDDRPKKVKKAKQIIITYEDQTFEMLSPAQE